MKSSDVAAVMHIALEALEIGHFFSFMQEHHHGYSHSTIAPKSDFKAHTNICRYCYAHDRAVYSVAVMTAETQSAVVA